MGPAKRAILDNAEAITFVVAVLVIATLLVWWSVFANNLVEEVAALSTAAARAGMPTDVPMEEALAQVQARASRQRVMLVGEGSVFAAMLLVCMGALFLVARARREAGRRLVRLLQFTTHELKTPIAGVRALLQSLQLGSVPEEQRARFLAQGLLETQRLEHLAETILAFQRATSRKRLRPVASPSDALLGELLEQRRRTFADEQTALTGQVSTEIVVDRDAFRVVLENLLDNARKYGGGKVELRARIEGRRWLLEVADGGVGFEPLEAERLFEPFERDEGSGVNARGSGLGLYISRRLMRDMGGDLTASSDGRGQGARFVVTVPVAEEAHG